jgi:hypothetical protein
VLSEEHSFAETLDGAPTGSSSQLLSVFNRNALSGTACASTLSRRGLYYGGNCFRLQNGSPLAHQAIRRQCVCGANVAPPFSKSKRLSCGCRFEGILHPKLYAKLHTTVDEKGVGLGQTTLTLWRKLRKLGLLLIIAPSSNGKTADSG